MNPRQFILILFCISPFVGLCQSQNDIGKKVKKIEYFEDGSVKGKGKEELALVINPSDKQNGKHQASFHWIKQGKWTYYTKFGRKLSYHWYVDGEEVKRKELIKRIPGNPSF